MKTKSLFTFALLCAVAQGAWAQASGESISYIDRQWDAVNKTVVETERTISTYTEITGQKENEYIDLESGKWYVVKGADVKRSRLFVAGGDGAEVHLILCDGAKLSAKINFETNFWGEQGNIHIYGQSNDSGMLYADGNKEEYYSAGIGASCYVYEVYPAGHTFIHGGTIRAYGHKHCAGIGGAHQDHITSGVLTVYGGDVVARGGDYAAGIGGGNNERGATVTIYGGSVKAYGGMDGAGIGSGEMDFTGEGGFLTVWGGYVYAEGKDWGAGIGGGEDSDGAVVRIYGGTVEARAGSDCGDKNGSAIGSEDGEGHRGTLTIADNLMVHAGQNRTDGARHLFSAAERKPACWYRPYTRIEPCNHEKGTYTMTGDTPKDTHTLHCPNCKCSPSEQHSFDDNSKCTVCGLENGKTCDVEIWLPKLPGVDYSSSGTYNGVYFRAEKFYMATGETFTVSAPPAEYLPEGAEFAGWRKIDPQLITPQSVWIGEKDTDLLQEGEEYTISGNYFILTARYRKVNISLADATDNSETLFYANGHTAEKVTLSGRTLYKDGAWNTLCLPFDLTISGSPLDGDGVTAKVLGNTSFTNGELTLDFNDAPATITAGTPFLIKWDNTGTTLTESDLVFSSVFIHNNLVDASPDYIDFIGTFSPTMIYQDGTEKTKLYLGADNTLYYPESEGFKVNACRGYFQLKGLTAGALSEGGGQVRAFNLNFGDDANGIADAIANSTLNQWYTLDGRRLTGKPTARGLYFRSTSGRLQGKNNGKKVIIK